MPMPAAAQTGFLDRRIVAGGSSFPYVVYVPRDYDSRRAWPVILFLHGAGERGTDGVRPTQVGLGSAIRFSPEKFPAIVVFPQVPPDQRWIDGPAEAAMNALDAVSSEFHVDGDRVYLTGISMGGYGAWHLAMAHRARFAAAIVVCGGLLPHESAKSVRRSPLLSSAADPYAAAASMLRGLPTTIFHGTRDTVVPVEESRSMAAALRQVDADRVRYVELPDVGHNAWDPAYADAALWEWLFAQRRSLNPAPLTRH